MKSSLILILLLVISCKTSGDLKVDKPEVDPMGIKTLDSPILAVPNDEMDSAPSGSIETLKRNLVVTQGELENLRYQMDFEKEASRARIAALEEENRKLTEALSASPAARNPVVAANSGEAQAAIELLWKQVVDGVKSGDQASALGAAKSIINNYPQSKRIWSASLVAGMLEYNAKNYKEAAIYFNSGIDMTAKRSVGVSLPWYFQGLSFMQLNKKEDAALFLGELQRKYPQSVAARKAKNLKTPPADLFKDVPNWLDFTGP